MAGKVFERIKNLYRKAKGVKNIEIIVAIILVALAVLIYSGVSKINEKKAENTVVKEIAEASATERLERQLEEVLSMIEGAGEVSVLINFSGTTEKVTASTKSVHNNTSTGGGSVISSTTTETETPVLVNESGTSSPYVINEKMPEIIGVIVVAEGANDPMLRLELMRGVQTVLNINSERIEIFEKNKK